MVQSMTHDVFISHSSKDKAIADAVCAALEAAEIKCWIAPRDILPADKWAGAITKATTCIPVFVLIFSKDSNNSENVLNELQLASDAGAELVPFKIENILPNGEMMFFLNRTHWLEATNPPTEEQIQELIETVNRFLKTENAEDNDQVEPVVLTPPVDKKKDYGKSPKTYFIVAAVILMLLVGFFMLEPDAIETSPADITENLEGVVLDDQNDNKYIDDLIESLSNSDENVRNDSFDALVEIGEPAIDPLIQALNGDEGTRGYVIQALGYIGEPAIDPLIQTTKDTNNFERTARYSAVQALGYIGEPAVEALIQILNEGDDTVRYWAALTLGDIGDSRAIGPLENALNDENPGVREKAKEALDKIST